MDNIFFVKLTIFYWIFDTCSFFFACVFFAFVVPQAFHVLVFTEKLGTLTVDCRGGVIMFIWFDFFIVLIAGEGRSFLSRSLFIWDYFACQTDYDGFFLLCNGYFFFYAKNQWIFSFMHFRYVWIFSLHDRQQNKKILALYNGICCPFECI